eukprot:CAMPEP_0181179834 /NCGR_PEP_ID=MMETSP1096-20121128/6474_1 /TAXON_ID=156174 ORGANISM="Chrysochromulina ericina, Strain CCMP281" /NCGR_SAMPLE_ID=MMETSP1096 /ASSEMBLY_ACC=CAM_ASM_000453 /LENGTH=383 /DNA_ID=CAMNT_0023268215 /DNA_START=734 /DNA_END=1882 /DNA_ORIENTATION=+
MGRALRLQVRSVDGAVFWVDTEVTATVGSIKQSIMELRGIDVVMQKLICAGRLLADDSTPEIGRITEMDFLVLVTAKPRPPSLMTTGAPLPSSYQTGVAHVGDGEDDDVDGGEEGEEEAGEVGEEEGGTDEADEVGRLVEMGFGSLEAEEALRMSGNDVRGALGLLRSGRVGAGDEAVRELHSRLRSLGSFVDLQQVVRVDPQIMLVLNTEAMRFEDPKSNGLQGEAAGAVSLEAHREREEVEKAFWEACTVELMDAPPVYDRTLQLVHEMRDTLCSLTPSGWEDQILLATDHAEHMRTALERLRDTSGALTSSLVTTYIRDVSAQVRMLCSEGRQSQMESLLASTLQQLETDMQAAEAHAAGSSGHGAGSSGHGAGSSGHGA